MHFTNNPSRMVEITGIQNNAFQNAASNLYIFDHQRVSISLASMLERFHTTIKDGSF